jgi:hypothetical protein
MAKSLHRQDVLFKVRGIAAYMDKGVYNMAVEGVLESTAREVCITFHGVDGRPRATWSHSQMVPKAHCPCDSTVICFKSGMIQKCHGQKTTRHFYLGLWEMHGQDLSFYRSLSRKVQWS